MLASLKEILDAWRQRSVPAHVTVLHYLGALALLCFGVQAFTGILLMLYYRPAAGAAHHSMAIIMDEVRFGWLVRSLHRWGSDLVIALGFLHLIRVYFSRAYQAPRQVNWMLGVLLILLFIALGFSGTLLPWDQYAYWYIDSARASISDVPLVGNFLLGVFWGGWELGEEVLIRFYALHIGIIPWAAAVVATLHMVLVWRFGIKPPPERAGRPSRPPMPFFPDFAVNLAIAALLLIGVLLSMAIVFPPPLLPGADPLTPLADAPPGWYLLPLRAVLRGLAGGTAALVVMAFVALVFLVPVLDRNPMLPIWKKLVQRGAGVVVIVLWVLLGFGAFR